MAHFRGTVVGNRGQASRLGTKSGINVTCRGWDLGVDVSGNNTVHGEDKFHIDINLGSNNPSSLLTFVLTNHDNYVRIKALNAKQEGLKDFMLEVAK